MEADEADEADEEDEAPMEAGARSRRMHERHALRCTDMVVSCPGFYKVAVVLGVVCTVQLVVLGGPMIGPMLSKRWPGLFSPSDRGGMGAPGSLV